MARIPLSKLPRGASVVVEEQGRNVAVFHTDQGVYAVDNACPHEGYPLVQGAVADCTLTCVWHNYKFDLRDGACIMGEEAVDAFPARIEGDEVVVDVHPPDPQVVVRKAWASLAEGLLEEQLGRVARDAARLLQAGVPAAELAVHAALHDARRARWGTSHALPVAADVLRYLPEHPGVDATLPLMQALELSARSNVRRPARERPEPEPPSTQDVGAELRRRVEAEDAPGAEALFRGALAAGARPDQVQAWLITLCADHFLDFGHALIYVVKAFDLLRRAPWSDADLLLGTLVFGITNGTREDLLPGWAGWRKRLAAVDLDELDRPALTPVEWDRDGWLAKVTHGKPASAFAATVDALRAGVPAMDVVDGLALGACERMLRLELSHDTSLDNQNGWLDVCHILTFVNAVRHALERSPGPGTLRLVFQAVRFVNHSRLLDGPAPRIRARPATVDEVVAAIVAGDVDAALDTAAGCEDVPGLWSALRALPLQDAAVRPIFTAHLIKTAWAATEEAEAADGDPRPLLATVRFFAAPKDERRLARRVHEALGFVVEGAIPTTLT
ncbi:MAG: Rieske (2Fe-2S) protein [Proteobacteria bacterium]|nr:Rieske (2Fe-2S) protein [Pseudomonadota bacterium]MCP4920500.1 Rieske (2Fe-2S) protein [Pseudomonadota bacterium]